MATTTNYSFPTPDDTDLVKDGASAIRSFGTAVDTQIKNLSPGTTAGDVDYYTTSTAKARLAIGTAGQVLTVNSGATAPEWAAPVVGGMTLISTTTLTGASVTLSSIPATYKDLKIIIRNYKPATDGTSMIFRLNADNGANRHATQNYNAGTFVSQTFGANQIILFETQDNSVDTNLAVVDIPDYTNATTWKMGKSFTMAVNSTTTTNYNFTTRSFFYNQTAAISSLLFGNGAGNFTSGEILLYGVN